MPRHSMTIPTWDPRWISSSAGLGRHCKELYLAHGGFSTFQLVFGKQLKLPNIMEDKLPALGGMSTSKSFATYITAMYVGRKAFTEMLYDEKVLKVHRHNVRASPCPGGGVLQVQQ